MRKQSTTLLSFRARKFQQHQLTSSFSLPGGAIKLETSLLPRPSGGGAKETVLRMHLISTISRKNGIFQ